MEKHLGIDLGTNSMGWAITEHGENNCKLLDKGVSIFQEGVMRTKSGEEPMVKTRTDKRALRRHYFRRRLRKIELLKVLIANDLCPYLSPEEQKAEGYDIADWIQDQILFGRSLVDIENEFIEAV